VTDRGVVNAGLLEPALSSLRTAGVAVTIFQDIKSNPTASSVDEAAELARAEGCDVVVALGGGSPIDAAKGAAVVLSLGGRCADHLGATRVSAPLLPIIAIPTTAGTGSEVTIWAVINNEEERFKSWIGGDSLLPTIALLDPEITTTMPPNLTAYTGIDALTHAIGAFTSTFSNPIADALAIAAIELIGKSLFKAVESPQDIEARSDMLLASTMAGAAFNSGKLVAVHCLSEALGGPYDIHHGLANAILLPHVMAFNASAIADKYARVARALGSDQSDGAEAVRRFMEPLQLPTLGQLGVQEADLPRVAALAFGNCSDGRNPRPMTEEDMLRLLRQAL